MLLLVSSAISGELLTKYGTDEQRRDWLPRMATGTKVVFAITEPTAGSNSHRISTSATRDGGDYVLNGTKYYISGVDEAAVLTPAGRGEDRSRPRGDDDRESRVAVRDGLPAGEAANIAKYAAAEAAAADHTIQLHGGIK